MEKEVTVSAPGKLMLLGEHAVIYEKRCLVTSVDQRLSIIARRISEYEFQLEAPEVKIIGYRKSLAELAEGGIPKGARFIEIALSKLFKNHQLPGGISFTTRSEFPPVFGFGSSSASAACAIKAASELFGLALSNREIFDIAFETVLEVQGVGSGFDVAAAVYGGVLEYISGGKLIEPLNCERLPMIIGYSGIKADTATIVKEVRARFESMPEIADNIWLGIEQLVSLAKRSLLGNDWSALGGAMNVNQGYLEALGVSTPILNRMIEAARSAGALGAKLSGAGGGDCIIAIARDENRSRVEQAIADAGGQILKVETNVEGVRVDR